MSRFVLIILLSFVLVGCRNSAKTPASDSPIHIEIEAETLKVGKSMLTVTLTDPDGQPFAVQKINVRGDMNHAGMMPVLAESPAGDPDSVYNIPFEWTMAGDWIVTVQATLADGTTAEQTFNYSISG